MKTTVITYGDGDEPTITIESDHARDAAPATVWQPAKHRRDEPFLPERQAPTFKQADTLLSRFLGEKQSQRGRVLFGGRITVDGEDIDVPRCNVEFF